MAATPPAGSRSFLLVSAPPGDSRAGALAGALRAAGCDVVLTDSPETAAMSAPAALACLVVMSAHNWNAPANIATVNASPPRLIPILAEPMALPPGPWSGPAIELRSTPADAARAVLATLPIPSLAANVPLAPGGPRPSSLPLAPGNQRPASGPPPGSYAAAPIARPEPPGSYAAAPIARPEPPGSYAAAPLARPEPPARNYTPADIASFPSRAVPPPPPIARRSAGSRASGRLRPALIAVVSLVVVAGVSGAIALNGKNGTTRAGVNDTAYAAALPGPGCDKGGATWDTASGPGLTATCQASGLLLTQTANFSALGEVFFRGTAGSFPASYRVAVTVAIQTGDAYTAVGLEVHRQTPQGGQVALLQAGGAWRVDHEATNGGATTRLAIGFLPQSVKSAALTVEVQGASLTFSVNDKPVATVLDATYATTDAIALVLGDPGATGPIAAQFSGFQYTPLTSAPVTAAQATATAQAAKPALYRATIPGPGCDANGGQWAPAAFLGEPAGTLTCASGGLQIAEAATSATLGEARFFWLTGAFPANASVAATINLSKLNDGCAGFLTRTNGAQGGYSYTICQGGAWSLDRVDATGAPTALAQGVATIGASVTLLAADTGATHALSVNGRQLGTATDAAYATTSFISLFAQTPASVNGAATFSNFVYTPLP